MLDSLNVDFILRKRKHVQPVTCRKQLHIQIEISLYIVKQIKVDFNFLLRNYFEFITFTLTYSATFRKVLRSVRAI